MRVLLEITKFHLHKSVPTAGIIRVAGIIRIGPYMRKYGTRCQVRLGQNRYDSKSLNILKLFRSPR